MGENPPTSPISMDESPCASPVFSLLHHSNHSSSANENANMSVDASSRRSLDRSNPGSGRKGRNLLNSFNSSEGDSDVEEAKTKKEKKRRDKKRR